MAGDYSLHGTEVPVRACVTLATASAKLPRGCRHVAKVTYITAKLSYDN